MTADRETGPEVDLDILVEDDRWESLGLNRIAMQAVKETLTALGIGGEVIELSLLACDDKRIAELNTEFRDKAAPTNVLSWPAEDLSAAAEGATPGPPDVGFDGVTTLGDVAIAYETCANEAETLAKPMAEHVTHLVVHGVLHLLGYDHIRDRDAALMERLETEILGKMGIDNPYREE